MTMILSSTITTKLFSFKAWLPSLNFTSKTLMDSPTKTLSKSSSRSLPRESDAVNGTVTSQEWQGWGSTSPVPIKVLEVIEDLKLLENSIDAQMSFGGNGGKLQGDFKIVEDKKHRATYQALDDSESKLQFYSARQIACRLLGSRGYLCQKCWLPFEEDCTCSKVDTCSLGPGIRFWVYMHPKDFLRQNNTGKLLWQVFGVQSATLCLYGIAEQEEMMWNALKLSGNGKVWCLYPNKNAEAKSVQDAFSPKYFADPGNSPTMTDEENILNFILIDGTWSNSGAMFRRLKDQAKLVWQDDLSCISLAAGASTMHKLRPQPSWDRTCTAGAAIGLLSELHLLPNFSSKRLDRQADALESSLLVLLEALTTRRLRMGRSITRKMRHNRDIC